jgi:glycine betaine/proline transport system ATP-binding protein
MKPLSGEPSGTRVPGDMTLEVAAKQITEAGQTGAVVTDASGKPIGTIDLQSIIAAMVTPTTHDTAEMAAA